MLNFITENNKKRVLLEYFSRVVIIFFVLLFIIIVIATILLVPSTFFSKYKNQTLTAQLYSIQNVYKNNGEDPSVLIRKLNASTKLFLSKSSPVSYSDVIQKIISIKNANIKITTISIQNTDSGKQVSISGRSQNRDTLTAFDKSLKIDGFFSNINLPISNLIKDDNPQFNITMTSK